jgi:hypothetical protein
MPPIQWVPGVKQPGREANYSPPTSAEVKETWNYTFTPPYAFINHRDNLNKEYIDIRKRYTYIYKG